VDIWNVAWLCVGRRVARDGFLVAAVKNVVSYDLVRGARGQISSDLLPKIRAEVYMNIAHCGEEGA
jgi:hypothetical protein